MSSTEKYESTNDILAYLSVTAPWVLAWKQLNTQGEIQIWLQIMLSVQMTAATTWLWGRSSTGFAVEKVKGVINAIRNRRRS